MQNPAWYKRDSKVGLVNCFVNSVTRTHYLSLLVLVWMVQAPSALSIQNWHMTISNDRTQNMCVLFLKALWLLWTLQIIYLIISLTLC